MLKYFKNLLRNVGPRKKLKFDSFTEGRVPSGWVEEIPDQELMRLNELLPWRCFTVDSRGRRFGDAAWAEKRNAPQVIPDPRIQLLNQLIGLEARSVLEVGCFEGIHTTALTRYAKDVHAIDSRIENVVKTLVRTNLFGVRPTVSLCDIEDVNQFESLPAVDVVHHVGVLYHLRDPVSHLRRLASKATDGILLDTHYATPAMANTSYQVDGHSFACHRYAEGGRNEVFSGMYDHAKWLLLDDIKALLVEAGFTDIRTAADEQQRNGPRVTLYAAKNAVMAPLSNAQVAEQLGRLKSMPGVTSTQ
jgi:2-polyprenyl-3-methyl-5-hydroxy-6-metoxy-1,4-benzoquinol methylase